MIKNSKILENFFEAGNLLITIILNLLYWKKKCYKFLEPVELKNL